MMTLMQLGAEFFCIGLFSIGGGMATVPFLMSLSERTSWFSLQELSNVIAIAEATPGPIGVNMSTYLGYHIAGIPGAVLATLFLTLPSFIIIFLLAQLIGKLRGNQTFESVFYGLRPASVGLISSVLLSLCIATFFTQNGSIMIHWKSIALFLFISMCLLLPKVRRLPIPIFLLLAVITGIIFHLGS
ncbi:MAG: chromate transporter [Evtepia sp.]|nr:chromate transporter [Evtepia sp.]